MEKIDLHTLKTELLCEEADACLPCNLSDHWLHTISSALEAVLTGDEDEMHIHMPAPLALILHILSAKQGGGELKVSHKELMEYFEDYHLEISIELVNRRTEIKSSPATLETIFTNRTIECHRQLDS